MNLLNVIQLFSKLCLFIIVFIISSPTMLSNEKSCQEGLALEIPLIIPPDVTAKFTKHLNDIIGSFNHKNQNKIKIVVYVEKKWEGCYEHILAKHYKQQPAGIALVPDRYVKDLIDKRAIISLEAFSKEHTFISKGDSWSNPNLRASNGEIFGLPYLEYCLMLYCNMTMLNEHISHNSQPCSPPKNYAEIEGLGYNYQSKESTTPPILIMGDYYESFFELMVAQEGTALMPGNNEVYLNSPTAIKVLTRLKHWYENRFIDIAPNWEATANNFMYKNNPIIAFSSGSIQIVCEKVQDQIDLEVVSMPSLTTRGLSAQRNAISICLSKYMSNKQKEGAKIFLKYLFESSNHAQISANTGYMPTLKSTYNQLRLKNLILRNNYFQNAQKVLTTNRAFRGTTTAQKEIEQFIREAIHNVFENGHDPEAALNHAQALAQEALGN